MTQPARYEYRMLHLGFNNERKERIGDVEVRAYPGVDAVMRDMASDGWGVHRFAVTGGALFIIFRRPAP